ncbi:MAG: restriction endonuclease subunit S [Imperialibacter sp.]|uniref:restriction endonuclease subunit S n=1 Tax=Imperialibacter sp. TaxID=2038411 RepID=UPI0032EBC6CC
MRFGLEEDTLEAIGKVLETVQMVDQALVFGSRAKGNYRADSDIDLALKGEHLTHADLLHLAVKLDDLHLPWKFDLINYHTIDDPAVVEHIDRVGSEMYSRRKIYSLEEISAVQTGPFGSQLHMSDYKTTGTPIITVEHLGENEILHNNLPLVGDEDRQRLIKYTLKEGDIVFSRVGSVDRRAYVSNKEDGWMFSGRCLRVRAFKEKVNPKFLSFYFGQDSFKETIRSIAVGATMPSINTTILNEIEVSIPPLPEQTAIASVLSSLDDKIDLLHRQNKTLEEMAEALFKQWFVVEADDDWEDGTLEDLARFYNGKTRPKEEGVIPVYGGNGILGYTGKFNYEGKSIVIGRVGAYCGSLYFESKKIWVSDNALLVKGLNENHIHYLFYLLKTLDLNSMALGSSHPLLTQGLLKSIEIKIPPAEKIEKFESQVSKIHEKIMAIGIQINTLAQLRNTLLPKLMSGEVRVKLSEQD